MEAAAEGIEDLSGHITDKVCAMKHHRTTAAKPRSTTSDRVCYRCGGPHADSRCRFKDSKCYKCQKIGHIAKVCRSTHTAKVQPKNKHKTHVLDENNVTEQSYVLYSMYSTSAPLCRNLLINGTAVKFQIDTGASLSVMNKKTFVEKVNIPLKPSSKVLKTYTGENVQICGEAEVVVTDDVKTATLPLVVVERGGPPLLGRDWIQHLHVDLRINTIDSHDKKLQKLLEDHDSVFKSAAGCLRDVKVTLHGKPDTTPKFYRARQPPYALREAIEEELSCLQRDGIVEPVDHSDWATPIVLVWKRDGTVRICGDYKITVNKVCKGDNHPIPRIEDLAYALSGGDKCTKLDLSHVYTQLQLDEESRKYTIINTHKGLFTYHRLCFGISAAPGIFQRTMEGVFRHVPGCVIYLDDVYVTGKNDEDHLRNLYKVLSICEEKGLSLRRDKCEFMHQEVTFLGYRLDKNGVYPLADKIKAIRDAPTPRNTQELRSFLGLINFYGKFIPNVSQVLAPLYQLLRQGQRWCWSKAFSKIKSVLSLDKVLVHFKSENEIVLVCDASPTGVGAILTQPDDHGHVRPVAYASRALNTAGLTDHKPLLGLFGEGKSIPEHASARVQRSSITLSAYSYKLQHRPGRENSADALSRLASTLQPR
ncbi:hypothetical protein RRG08_032091 [Elysia crispata]|uniref:Reverse transcriptase n=1 Tax=Elysia crispata TaxID=231223 RepID=A0AAE1DEY3_9GAST|nr:hypothetical protein RRG08_032091 [Elysia crispata]